jgi:hypothetical protein
MKAARPDFSKIGLQREAGWDASIRLGGTTIWGANEVTLSKSLEALRNAIVTASGLHLTTTKAVLRKLVRENLGQAALDERMFSAVVGSVLRVGHLDTLLCASKNDRLFPVLVSQERIEALALALDTARQMLRESDLVTVPELEAVLFGKRAYNTWSSSSHVLGHLAFLGFGLIDESGDCHLIKGLV